MPTRPVLARAQVNRQRFSTQSVQSTPDATLHTDTGKIRRIDRAFLASDPMRLQRFFAETFGSAPFAWVSLWRLSALEGLTHPRTQRRCGPKYFDVGHGISSPNRAAYARPCVEQ